MTAIQVGGKTDLILYDSIDPLAYRMTEEAWRPLPTISSYAVAKANSVSSKVFDVLITTIVELLETPWM